MILILILIIIIIILINIQMLRKTREMSQTLQSRTQQRNLIHIVLIFFSRWMDDAALELLTPQLVAPRPNTYTFTKALAEQLLLEEKEHVPTSIVRPSIVGASWQEPFVVSIEMDT